MTDSMALFNSRNDSLPMPLTTGERAELAKLEELVTTGISAFVTAGKALARIKEKQLYRETHDTFEAYVGSRWSMTRQHAARLIEAAEVVRNLSPVGSEVVPASERQARPLAGLTPEKQREAWVEVVEGAPVGADGRPLITAQAVAKAASKRKPKSKAKRARTRPVRVRVPGATVTITPNGKWNGSAIEALQAAVSKLVSEQSATRQAA